MSGMKTAEEKAQDYLEHASVPPGECSMYWKEGFYAGHTEGLREAGELSHAVDRWFNATARNRNNSDVRNYQEFANECMLALDNLEIQFTKFKARIGQATAGDE